MKPRNLWRRLADTLRGVGSCTTGATATEFAMIVPVIGLVLAGTVDLAELGNQGALLDAALRAGADYAIADPTNTAAITSRITGYATKWGGSTPVVTFLNPEDANTSWYPQFCTCDGDSISNGKTLTCNNDTSTGAGGAICPLGATGLPTPKHFYITIKAVESNITPLVSGILGNCTTGSGFCVSRSLTVRVL